MRNVCDVCHNEIEILSVFCEQLFVIRKTMKNILCKTMARATSHIS